MSDQLPRQLTAKIFVWTFKTKLHRETNTGMTTYVKDAVPLADVPKVGQPININGMVLLIDSVRVGLWDEDYDIWLKTDPDLVSHVTAGSKLIRDRFELLARAPRARKRSHVGS